MEITLSKDSMRISEPVFDTAAEHPVENDVVLPDYCPDIARVLKTEASASVDKKTFENRRLTAEGVFAVKIIYIADNSSSIRSFTYETPFSHEFDTGDACENPVIQTGAKVGYLSCRSVGPRRLQIRASVSVSAKLWCERDEEFISDCDDERVEVLRRQVRAANLVGAAEKPFRVEEELELGYGKPAIAAVIRCNATAVVQDYKVIANKVIAKGELLLHTLYSPDLSDSKLETMDHTVPVSQIVDLQGVDENCICQVRFTAPDIKVEPAQDNEGENRRLLLSANVNAQVSARRTKDFNVITDAYSPAFEMELDRKPLPVEFVADNVRSNESVRMTMDAPENAVSISDCTARAEITGVRIANRSAAVSGEMSVSLMAADEQGGPLCLEKTLPFSVSEELHAEAPNLRFDPDVTVLAVSASLAGGRAELRVDCLVSGLVFGSSSENVVSGMALDENSPKAGNRRALTLYFADQGERLWDIAKRYDTSMDAIRRENSLEADALPERQMLLIPKKRGAKSS